MQSCCRAAAKPMLGLGHAKSPQIVETQVNRPLQALPGICEVPRHGCPNGCTSKLREDMQTRPCQAGSWHAGRQDELNSRGVQARPPSHFGKKGMQRKAKWSLMFNATAGFRGLCSTGHGACRKWGPGLWARWLGGWGLSSPEVKRSTFEYQVHASAIMLT